MNDSLYNDSTLANNSISDHEDSISQHTEDDDEEEDKKEREEDERERLKDEEEDRKEREEDERERLKDEKEFFITKDGKKVREIPNNGLYKFHYEDGQMAVHYKNGKKNGEALTYDANGILLIRVNFVDDKLEGLATQYYYDGNIETIFHYKTNKKTGPMTSYYQNNVKRFDANLLDDELEGMFIFYDQYGDKSQVSYYKKGYLDGPSTTFFPKSQGGGVCRVCHYEKGQLVKEDQFFYPDGKPLQTTTYDHKGRALVYPTNFKPSGEIV